MSNDATEAGVIVIDTRDGVDATEAGQWSAVGRQLQAQKKAAGAARRPVLSVDGAVAPDGHDWAQLERNLDLIAKHLRPQQITQAFAVGTPVPEIVEFLDLCLARQFGVITSFYRFKPEILNNTADLGAYAAEVMAAVRGHKALRAWWLLDEPLGAGYSFADVTLVSQAAGRLAAGVPRMVQVSKEIARVEAGEFPGVAFNGIEAEIIRTSGLESRDDGDGCRIRLEELRRHQALTRAAVRRANNGVQLRSSVPAFGKAWGLPGLSEYCLPAPADLEAITAAILSPALQAIYPIAALDVQRWAKRHVGDPMPSLQDRPELWDTVAQLPLLAE